MESTTEKPINNVDRLEDADDNPTLAAQLARAAKLKDEIDTLEVALSKAKKYLETCEKVIVEQLQADGITSITKCGRTFYLQPQIFVNKKGEEKGVTTDMLCDTLEQVGLGYLVSKGRDYNANKLKAAIREMKGNEEDIPEQLEKLLNIYEPTALIQRRV